MISYSALAMWSIVWKKQDRGQLASWNGLASTFEVQVWLSTMLRVDHVTLIYLCLLYWACWLLVLTKTKQNFKNMHIWHVVSMHISYCYLREAFQLLESLPMTIFWCLASHSRSTASKAVTSHNLGRLLQSRNAIAICRSRVYIQVQSLMRLH